MRTCENCGADALDSRGICQNCGWGEQEIHDSSPSLGETRAAGVPTTNAGNRGIAGSSPLQSTVAPSSPFERTVDMPRYTPPVPPSRTGASSVTNTPGGISRYCGTCGARIERGEVFCGQCGTPVGAGGNNLGNLGGGRGTLSSAPSRYVVGDEEAWSPAHGDELTEASLQGPPPPMPAQYGRGVSNAPYGQGYGAVASYPASPVSESARTTRIIWGIVCLVASLMVAVAAVVVALH